MENVGVPRHATTFMATGLNGGYDYQITVISLCSFERGKEESEPTTINVTTPPEPITGLKLESSTPSSMTLKWDSANLPLAAQNYRIKISLEGLDGYEFSQEVFLAGEETQYVFSKLPDPSASGRMFKATAVLSFLTQGEYEVSSNETSVLVCSPPHKPTNLKISKGTDFGITWTKSETQHVTRYKLKWKPDENGCRSCEGIVYPNMDQNDLESFVFPSLKDGSLYKVSVYAVVDFENGNISESKKLQGKICVKDQTISLVE